jgi:hypothetical protein
VVHPDMRTGPMIDRGECSLATHPAQVRSGQGRSERGHAPASMRRRPQHATGCMHRQIFTTSPSAGGSELYLYTMVCVMWVFNQAQQELLMQTMPDREALQYRMLPSAEVFVGPDRVACALSAPACQEQ